MVQPHKTTSGTRWLTTHGVAFEVRPYDYVPKGGTAEASRQLGMPAHQVVKTLVMKDQAQQPLLVLMHGDRKVSTKALAREIDRKTIEPCSEAEAHKHTGYLVGGTSLFGTKRALPVFVEASILALDRILINGGQRGFLVEIDPRVLVDVLGATPVECSG